MSPCHSICGKGQFRRISKYILLYIILSAHYTSTLGVSLSHYRHSEGGLESHIQRSYPFIIPDMWNVALLDNILRKYDSITLS